MDRNMTTTGKIVMEVIDGKLVLDASEGLVMAALMGGSGAVVWFHHPLTGWYIEHDFRRGSTEDEPGAKGSNTITS